MRPDERKNFYVPERDHDWWKVVEKHANEDKRWGSMSAFVRDAVYDFAARLGIRLPKREGP